MNSGTLVVLKTASDIGGKIAIFLVMALAARALPTQDFALLALASTTGWLVSVGTDFGLQVFLAREIARAPERAGATLWPLVAVRVRFSIAGAVLIAAIAVLWPVAQASALAFSLIALSYVANAMAEFLNYAYRGLGRSEFESGLNFTQRIVSLAVAAVWLRLSPSTTAVGVALLVPALLTCFVSARVLATLAPKPSGMSKTTTPPVPFAIVAPIGIGILLSALYFRIDLYLVEWWSGTEAVARYGAAFRLLDGLRLFPAAVLTVVMPAMFRGRDTRTAWNVAAGLGAFGCAAALVLYFAAPWAVPLAFGASYADATPLLQILLLALPLMSLNYGMTTQLLGWDGQWAFAATCSAALAANIAMNAMLIPTLGAAGAAWSTVGTEAVVTIACVVFLRRRWPAARQ